MSLCVRGHDVFLLLCSSSEPSCGLNELPLLKGACWGLKPPSKCVLGLIDNNTFGIAQMVLVCRHECVCMYVCVCAHTHTQVEWSKYLFCGRKCEIQERFTATVDKVRTDMMSLSGNTYTLANTLKLCLKHRHTAMERESQKLGADGGWQKRAPRGANKDSSVTAHHLPYLHTTSTHKQTHMFCKQKHIYHLSDCHCG